MELAKERGAYAAFPGSEWSKGKLLGSKSLEEILPLTEDPQRWSKLAQDVQIYGIRNSHITAIGQKAQYQSPHLLLKTAFGSIGKTKASIKEP